MKIKVIDCDEKSLQRIKEININKAKIVFQLQPFATKLYVAMKTKLDLEFIKNNWPEITK